MAYNLCDQHANGLSVPRGWELLDRRDVPDLLETHPTMAS
jgi:Protein of unknown function (DUF3499)